MNSTGTDFANSPCFHLLICRRCFNAPSAYQNRGYLPKYYLHCKNTTLKSGSCKTVGSSVRHQKMTEAKINQPANQPTANQNTKPLTKPNVKRSNQHQATPNTPSPNQCSSEDSSRLTYREFTTRSVAVILVKAQSSDTHPVKLVTSG
jgi:hypothetical protein